MGCQASKQMHELPPLEQQIRNQHYKHAPSSAILADSHGKLGPKEQQAVHKGQRLSYAAGPRDHKGSTIVLSPKPGQPNSANCDGIYEQVGERNGFPLYENAGSSRYLGWAGFVWAVTKDPELIKENGCDRGWHFSNNQGITSLAAAQFTEYDVLISEADIAAYVEADKQLFKEGVDPDDINQGMLGDCWLMGAMSALAEFEDAVRWIFCQRETCDAEGNYALQLYDVVERRWVAVSADAKSVPYGHAKSGEKWVPVLEKAFADKFGGYEQLNGNNCSLALMMLTGGDALDYTVMDDGTWLEAEARPALSGPDRFDYKTNNRAFYIWSSDTSPRLRDDEMWAKLRTFDDRGCVMGCTRDGLDVETMEGGATSASTFGMVDGHVYSLIQVKDVEGFRLIECRNPWGKTEWGGDWSDKSELWEAHPQVKEALNWNPNESDGRFWICFEDFRKEFPNLSVCTRPAFPDQPTLPGGMQS